MEAEILETIQIVRTPDVLGGKPRIKGHRISVQLIAELHEQAGKSVDEIIQQMPTINRAEVYAALSYYYAHHEEIDAQTREEEKALANDPHVIHINVEDFLAGKADLELTPQEIAQEYKITAEAVYQAVRRGTIPHRRSGTTILIPRWEAEKRWRNKSKRGRPRKKAE